MISNIVFSLVIVAEVTQPSTGVGYELGRAVAMNKRILCLYRPQENKRKFTIFFTEKYIHNSHSTYVHTALVSKGTKVLDQFLGGSTILIYKPEISN